MFKGNGATEPVLKAGLAHLWFVTIHPFEDGRIARAVAAIQALVERGLLIQNPQGGRGTSYSLGPLR